MFISSKVMTTISSAWNQCLQKFASTKSYKNFFTQRLMLNIKTYLNSTTWHVISYNSKCWVLLFLYSCISTMLESWQNVTIWCARVVGPMAWVPSMRNPIVQRNFLHGGTFSSTWLTIIDVWISVDPSSRGPKWSNNHQCTSWLYCPLDGLCFFIQHQMGFITIHFFRCWPLYVFWGVCSWFFFPRPDLTHSYPTHLFTIISIVPTLVPY
jgi:hypothetical protein